MVKLTIDGTIVEVEPNTSILKACEKINVEIPVFCYHEKLKVAGNCRMCLVEVEGSKKPVASCHNNVKEGMIVSTNSEKVKNARNGVLEFLLINHPLDCPICDQGGECDLQDITLNYSRGKGRYEFEKRAVKDKNIGPLIKTVMNRCIHCTRCIRFCEEIAGTGEMATIGRGEHTEIVTYLESAIKTELAGNLIDICPVGALTNKPYAYTHRKWELKKTNSIDVMDAVGSHVRIDSYKNQVRRILPISCDHINEEWISDKTRFAYDGLNYQRLQNPYLKDSQKLKIISWDQAFKVIKDKLSNCKPDQIAALAGSMADCETMFCLKQLLDKMGCKNYDCRPYGFNYPIKFRGDYLFNTSIACIEKADALLIIGSNPRLEATMVNARIKKAVSKNNLQVGVIGVKNDLSYPYDYLGNESRILRNLIDETVEFSNILKKAKNPMVILGVGALNRNDSHNIFHLAQIIAEKFNMIRDDWNGFNVLHSNANVVGGLDLGFFVNTDDIRQSIDTQKILQKSSTGEIKFLFLSNFDDLENVKISSETFVVYQGHSADFGVSIADVILPSLAYTEKKATFVNTEGRVQSTSQAVDIDTQAKEDWKIIRALSEKLGYKIEFDTIDQVRDGMKKYNPIFNHYNVVNKTDWAFSYKKNCGNLSHIPFKDIIKNYYQNDPISKNSKIMSDCSRMFL
jgi:NADH-quinone oxidoreductase subunit G